MYTMTYTYCPHTVLHSSSLMHVRSSSSDASHRPQTNTYLLWDAVSVTSILSKNHPLLGPLSSCHTRSMVNLPRSSVSIENSSELFRSNLFMCRDDRPSACSPWRREYGMIWYGVYLIAIIHPFLKHCAQLLHKSMI